jgi:molybdopterin/thiamine biosynthesis adenylyltransferase
MVVGAGAVGSEILKTLALLRVGRLTIVDFDVIEASNRSRTVLFTAADVRRSTAVCRRRSC